MFYIMIQQNSPSKARVLAPEFAPFPVDPPIRLLFGTRVPNDPINSDSRAIGTPTVQEATP